MRKRLVGYKRRAVVGQRAAESRAAGLLLLCCCFAAASCKLSIEAANLLLLLRAGGLLLLYCCFAVMCQVEREREKQTDRGRQNSSRSSNRSSE